MTHLVRDGLGVATALEGSADGDGARPESRTSNSEGVHGGLRLWENCGRGVVRARPPQSFVVGADLAGCSQIRLAGIVRAGSWIRIKVCAFQLPEVLAPTRQGKPRVGCIGSSNPVRWMLFRPASRMKSRLRA
jgi:hypothetical protein